MANPTAESRWLVTGDLNEGALDVDAEIRTPWTLEEEASARVILRDPAAAAEASYDEDVRGEFAAQPGLRELTIRGPKASAQLRHLNILPSLEQVELLDELSLSATQLEALTELARLKSVGLTVNAQQSDKGLEALLERLPVKSPYQRGSGVVNPQLINMNARARRLEALNWTDLGSISNEEASVLGQSRSLRVFTYGDSEGVDAARLYVISNAPALEALRLEVAPLANDGPLLQLARLTHFEAVSPPDSGGQSQP